MKIFSAKCYLISIARLFLSDSYIWQFHVNSTEMVLRQDELNTMEHQANRSKQAQEKSNSVYEKNTIRQ